MASQCSICLSSIKEPVSIPCGHVYCAACLGEHIDAASPDGYTSTCPTCRTEFPIVSPERICLPKQVQKFISPVIRRVYLPDAHSPAENQQLRNCLSASQNARQQLEDHVVSLMEQCERHMSASAAHAKGEKDAIMEVERLRRKLEYEIGLRKAAEMARDDEMQHALKMKEVIDVYRNKLENRVRHQRMDGGEELVSRSGTGSISALWAQTPLPIQGKPSFSTGSSNDGDDNESLGITIARRPVGISSRLRDSDQTERQNKSQSQRRSSSHPSPIHRPNKRHLENSNLFSDSDSDGVELLSDDEESDAIEPQQDIYNYETVLASRPSSSITPRRRVVRQLPPQPPTKRIRA